MNDINHPLPLAQGAKANRLVQLQVGESFFVEADRKQINCWQVSACVAGLRHKMLFVTRQSMEDGLNGLRIWRKS